MVGSAGQRSSTRAALEKLLAYQLTLQTTFNGSHIFEQVDLYTTYTFLYNYTLMTVMASVLNDLKASGVYLDFACVELSICCLDLEARSDFQSNLSEELDSNLSIPFILVTPFAAFCVNDISADNSSMAHRRWVVDDIVSLREES